MAKEESTGKLESSKQKKVKVLSKILEVIVIICKVVLWFGIVCMAIVAVAVPLVMKDVTISKESISYRSYTVDIKEEGEGIKLYYKDEKIADVTGIDKEVFFKVLESYPPKRITAILEVILITAIIILVVTDVMLKNLRKLFKNIHDQETPFTEENTNLLKKIGLIQIIIVIISFVGSIAVAIAVGENTSINFSVTNISWILGVYLLAYIFEYGTKLQEKSKSKIYDE